MLFVHKHRLFALGFGILTPKAAQGAALQKHRGAYARPIMGRIALNIKNLPNQVTHLFQVYYTHLLLQKNLKSGLYGYRKGQGSMHEYIGFIHIVKKTRLTCYCKLQAYSIS